MLPSWNVGPPPKVYYTWLREKMEHEEKAHYQKEIESIKCDVARLTNLLEQVLSFKNGTGTSVQPLMEASSAHVPHTSQKLGADFETG